MLVRKTTRRAEPKMEGTTTLSSSGGTPDETVNFPSTPEMLIGGTPR